MFRRVLAIIATSLIAGGLASAAEVSGYLVGTSDYVYRGVTQSDGHAAVQAGLDANFVSGFFLGAWGSTVDIPGPANRQRQSEVRVYLGYGFDINEKLRMVLNTVAYRYPGSEGNVDYDNQETSVSLGIADQYWIEYAYSPNLYDQGVDTHNVEVFAEWPLGKDYLLSAGPGHFQVDWPTSTYGNETLYWQIGISRSFSAFDVDLRYHEAEDAVRFTSNDDRIGSRVALSIRLGF
jgi:uncharacterized protein (TIGR02001 family)